MTKEEIAEILKKYKKPNRFFVNFKGEWLRPFLYQPRWLRRWYYVKSRDWWGHPSHHHWKQTICTGLPEGAFKKWWEPDLKEMERDLWTGEFIEGRMENENK